MAITVHVSVRRGRPDLTVTLPDRSIVPTRYDADRSALVMATGRVLVQLRPASRAAVEAAIAEARPAVWQEAIGDAAVGEGWEYVGTRGDVLGVYRRLISDAISPVITLG